AAKRSSRLDGRFLKPNIICLFAYLAFAGASVLWAYSPDLSFIRFAQQLMIITSIVLSSLLASDETDILRWTFLCFALSVILNLCFVLVQPPEIVQNGAHIEAIGYPGYFLGKNYLGECAAVTLIFAMYEIFHKSDWRIFSIIILVVSVYLLFAAGSKTA